MRYHFHHRDSGVLHEKVYVNNIADPELSLANARLNAPPDHVPIAGSFDHHCEKIDLVTGKVEPYQPPAPSADHEWHGTARRWFIKEEIRLREEAKAAARARVTELEIKQMRAIRELALGYDGARERLKEIDDEIIQHRGKLNGSTG